MALPGGDSLVARKGCAPSGALSSESIGAGSPPMGMSRLLPRAPLTQRASSEVGAVTGPLIRPSVCLHGPGQQLCTPASPPLSGAGEGGRQVGAGADSRGDADVWAERGWKCCRPRVPHLHLLPVPRLAPAKAAGAVADRRCGSGGPVRRGVLGLLRGWVGACSEGAFLGFVLLFLREARALRVFMCLPACRLPPQYNSNGIISVTFKLQIAKR